LDSFDPDRRGHRADEGLRLHPPDGGGKDVFVHISAVEKAGFTGLPRYRTRSSATAAKSRREICGFESSPPVTPAGYAKYNLTLNPNEIDWDRTVKPWKWF
jgi:hypothetical protein